MRTLLICLFFFPFILQAQIVVLPDGKIGIGTETPSYPIEIKDNNVRIGNGTNNSLFVGQAHTWQFAGIRNAKLPNDGSYMIMQHYLGSTYVNATSGRIIRFSIGNKEKMRLTSAGRFGIGVAAPTEKLHVNGNIKATGMVSSSDKRLKNNISEYSRGLKEVLQLNPINFIYNGKAGISSKENQIGLAAQELQKVVPEMVQEFTHQELDTLDKVISEEQYLQIVESDIKYLLINAIKEQQVMIDDLSLELRELKESLSSINKIPTQNIDLNGENKLAFVDQNRPNPFKGRTSINYFIPINSRNALIEFYDLSGSVIQKEAITNFGEGELDVNISNIPSGQYIYKLLVDDKIVSTKKMVIAQ